MSATLRLDPFPTGGAAAARLFYERDQGRIETALADTDMLTVIFPPAASDHDDWRRAAIRDLARAHTPSRINGVASDDAVAIAATHAYLADAPGVTGQFFTLDPHGAGDPLRESA